MRKNKTMKRNLKPNISAVDTMDISPICMNKRKAETYLRIICFTIYVRKHRFAMAAIHTLKGYEVFVRFELHEANIPLAGAKFIKTQRRAGLLLKITKY